MLHCRPILWVSILTFCTALVTNLSAQTNSATIALKPRPHIQMFGYAAKDSVTVEELVTSGGFGSTHSNLKIESAEIMFPSLCVGGTLSVHKTTGKFDANVLSLIRRLEKGAIIMIENIQAKDEKGKLVNLRHFYFHIK